MRDSSKFQTPIQRIILDVSHTYNSLHKTGIQRVVRSLLAELPLVAKERRLKFLPVILRDGRFIELPTTEQNSQKSWSERVRSIQSDLQSVMPSWYRSSAEQLCSLTRSRKLRKWLLPQANHQGLFKLPLKIVKTIAKHLDRFRANEAPEIQFNEHDLMIMPDGYWVMMHIWPSVAKARCSGCKIAVISYDTLCVTHPQFFVPHAKESFTSFLREVKRYADCVASISDAGRKQLMGLLPNIASDVDGSPTFVSFRLGAEFSEGVASAREDLKNAFASDASTYLMVSTFEPRKNHRFALDTFEKLWAAGIDCRLVFVGAVGWMSEDFLAKLASHPERNRRLFVFHDLSDTEVNYCYQQCAAAVFPSYMEGFGLPIVEGLRHGRRMFASDNPVHREAGAEEAVYFDLNDKDSLFRLVRDWENVPRDQRTFTPKPAMTWHESTRQLVERILGALASSKKFGSKRIAA